MSSFKWEEKSLPKKRKEEEPSESDDDEGGPGSGMSSLTAPSKDSVNGGGSCRSIMEVIDRLRERKKRKKGIVIPSLDEGVSSSMAASGTCAPSDTAPDVSILDRTGNNNTVTRRLYEFERTISVSDVAQYNISLNPSFYSNLLMHHV